MFLVLWVYSCFEMDDSSRQYIQQKTYWIMRVELVLSNQHKVRSDSSRVF